MKEEDVRLEIASIVLNLHESETKHQMCDFRERWKQMLHKKKREGMSK
jgi:hypothetical protein